MTVSYNPWLASCRSFTNRSLVALDLLKIFTADGVDYLFRSATSSKDFSYILQTLTLPMVVPICRSKFIMDQPYWRNFTYDPTLTALYDDPEIHNPITNPSKPNNKNRLNPAAYAVPIAIVALALGAVAVALFTPLRQVFTKKTKTIPAKDFSDLTKNTIHESRNAPPATEPTKSANTWVRSSKVDH